ncbi:unnamed protein product [Protopolystoma xenopodis]|uniref:Uncharacterized protein n=1 Tax=Protopolystoma xenopodis TaxID=117903 RepID=A0A3S5AB01_9PLAT|nr:unnamed protein product [Protopolystoma xenopodis]
MAPRTNVTAWPRAVRAVRRHRHEGFMSSSSASSASSFTFSFSTSAAGHKGNAPALVQETWIDGPQALLPSLAICRAYSPLPLQPNNPSLPVETKQTNTIMLPSKTSKNRLPAIPGALVTSADVMLTIETSAATNDNVMIKSLPQYCISDLTNEQAEATTASDVPKREQQGAFGYIQFADSDRVLTQGSPEGRSLQLPHVHHHKFRNSTPLQHKPDSFILLSQASDESQRDCQHLADQCHEAGEALQTQLEHHPQQRNCQIPQPYGPFQKPKGPSRTRQTIPCSETTVASVHNSTEPPSSTSNPWAALNPSSFPLEQTGPFSLALVGKNLLFIFNTTRGYEE